jgi:hypothetical protein
MNLAEETLRSIIEQSAQRSIRPLISQIIFNSNYNSRIMNSSIMKLISAMMIDGRNYDGRFFAVGFKIYGKSLANRIFSGHYIIFSLLNT